MTRMQRAFEWIQLALAALAERPADQRHIARRIELQRRDVFRRAAARSGTW